MTSPKNSVSALSLLETIIVVAALGILAAIAIGHQGASLEEVRVAKLTCDLSTINGALKVYVANGGSLTGVTEPQEILNKMKTTRTAEDEARFVGFGGTSIDDRLAVRLMTNDGSSKPRAIWNATAGRFELATSGAGVESFFLNEAFGHVNYGTETRDASAFAYNSGDGWIWNYADAAPMAHQAPTAVNLNNDPGGPVGGGEESTPGSGDPVLSQLSPPQFSIPGGNFRPTQFPTTLTLINPNPADSSHILVSVNGDDFQTYAGPMNLSPAMTVVAFVTGDPTYWVPSPTVDNEYIQDAPEVLNAPVIAASHSQFNWETAETVSVSISHSNDPEISTLQFQVGTEGWQTYSGSFEPSMQDYSNGAAISARAIPLTEDYATSPVANATIAPAPEPEQLLSPVVSPSAPNFIAAQVDAITITLQDRNETGSELQYRVGGGAWVRYAGAFTVTRETYPTGLVVEARAQATSRAYLDSAVANAAIGVTTAKLKTPVISPSAPNFMAGSVETITVAINNPNTTGSTLEYRINGGSWQTYRNSFAVTRSSYPSGLPIDARARATSSSFTDSDTANTRLGLTQVQLLAPAVTSTAPNFVAGSVESIWMTLSNPNAAGSTLEYRLNGSTWRAYTGSFKVTRSTYATGVLVEGRARATSTAYLDSPNGSKSIGLTPVQLMAPSIRKTAPYFAAGVVETIGITILNPNSAGSTLQYRINGGSWINYGGGFNVTRSSYPTGLTIEARARATSVAYLDSPTASTTITANSGPVQKVTLTFSSLSSSAGYLNEAFIAVNGDSYYLGNSDMGAGTTVNVDIFVNPTVTNVFDLTIDTYKRSGSTFTSGALRGMDTRNGSQFTVIPTAASFAGPASNAGKIKDQSNGSRIQMVVGYEDLIITGETPDYDYNDFQFEVKAPQAVNLIFGGYSRGM